MTTIDTSTPIDPATLDRAELVRLHRESDTPDWLYRLQLQRKYGDLAAVANRTYDRSIAPRGHRRFTDAEIRDIRALAATVPQKHLARQYGICASVINAIVHGRIYRDVVSVSKRKAA